MSQGLGAGVHAYVINRILRGERWLSRCAYVLLPRVALVLLAHRLTCCPAVAVAGDRNARHAIDVVDLFYRFSPGTF